MKRALSLILALMLCLSLCACQRKIDACVERADAFIEAYKVTLNDSFFRIFGNYSERSSVGDTQIEGPHYLVSISIQEKSFDEYCAQKSREYGHSDLEAAAFKALFWYDYDDITDEAIDMQVKYLYDNVPACFEGTSVKVYISFYSRAAAKWVIYTPTEQ